MRMRTDDTGRRYMTRSIGDITATAREVGARQFAIRVTRRDEDEKPISMQLCIGVSNARKLLRSMLNEAVSRPRF